MTEEAQSEINQPELPKPPKVQTIPYLTADVPGIGGIIKQEPEDFTVEEIPAYEPIGEGEHLFVWIEKREVSSEQLTRHVADKLSLSPRDIGTAGLKDRQAVTRQYISVPAKCEPNVESLNTDSIRVLHSKRHQNKLRTGHLNGNRFSILIRDVDAEMFDNAETIGKRITSLGFPNAFGEQRFGHDGSTLKLGFDLLTGRTTQRKLSAARRRFLLRLALSAVQSELFNRVLSERITDELLHTVLEGDVMQVHPTGGCFVVDDVETDQRRFDAREIMTTGPIFGPKMKAPSAAPAEREQRVLKAMGLEPACFQKFRKLTQGTRRPLIVRPDEFSVKRDAGGLRLRFTLPSGTYATTLLREFQKNE